MLIPVPAAILVSFITDMHHVDYHVTDSFLFHCVSVTNIRPASFPCFSMLDGMCLLSTVRYISYKMLSYRREIALQGAL